MIAKRTLTILLATVFTAALWANSENGHYQIVEISASCGYAPFVVILDTRTGKLRTEFLDVPKLSRQH